MSKLSAEAKVGVFVVIGIVILAYMSMKVGKLSLSRDKGYPVQVYFDSATGLALDVPVEIAGVEVGRVSKIELADGKALVTLRINSGVKITKDAKALIRTRGILGDKYVELVSGSPEAPLIKPGERIVRTAPHTDLDMLMNTLGEVARDVRQLTASLANVVGGKEGETALRSIIQNMKEMVETLNQTVQENNEDISNIIENLSDFSAKLKEIGDTNTDDIRVIVANVRRVSESLEGLVEGVNKISSKINKGEGTLGRLINEEETIDNLNAALASLKEITEKINQGEGTLGRLVTEEDTAEKIDRALTSITEVTDKINKGEGTIGRLINEEQTVENLNTTLTSINDYIQRQESFRTFIDYRGEYLFDTEGTKSYLTLRLQPKYDKYYLFQVVGSSLGREEVTDITTISDGNESHTRVIVNERDKLLFSAQIAKRYYDLNLRGGLFESTAGVAMDYYFFRDNMILSLEAFDFDPDRNPHLKLKADFSPFKHIYLSTGLDNFISDEGRESFFLGVGITFSDEDIKSLFSSVPLPAN